MCSIAISNLVGRKIEFITIYSYYVPCVNHQKWNEIFHMRCAEEEETQNVKKNKNIAHKIRAKKQNLRMLRRKTKRNCCVSMCVTNHFVAILYTSKRVMHSFVQNSNRKIMSDVIE